MPIGTWVIQEACRQAMKWPEDVRVAVNVSSVQFRKPGLANVLMQALAASGLDPKRLEVEITELIFLESSEALIAVLHSLRSAGHPHRARRFRHRLFEPVLSAELPVRQDQDRPLVHPAIAEPRRLDRDRPRDHRPRPRARHGDDRRGRRESGAARRAARCRAAPRSRAICSAGRSTPPRVLEALAAANPGSATSPDADEERPRRRDAGRALSSASDRAL